MANVAIFLYLGASVIFWIAAVILLVWLFRFIRVLVWEHDLRIRAEALGEIPPGDRKAFRRWLERDRSVEDGRS